MKATPPLSVEAIAIMLIEDCFSEASMNRMILKEPIVKLSSIDSDMSCSLVHEDRDCNVLRSTREEKRRSLEKQEITPPFVFCGGFNASLVLHGTFVLLMSSWPILTLWRGV